MARIKLNGNGKKEMTDRIAMGAMGVAITAGVVAVGAALMKSKNREMLGKSFASTTKALESAVQKAPRVMQGAIAHQVRSKKGRRS